MAARGGRAVKVLDLRCTLGHTFEGWFGSDDDYRTQQSQRRIECPLCGSDKVHKILSAPRLNLGHADVPSQPSPAHAKPDVALSAALQAAWQAMARHIVAHTVDVGNRFAEEARRIHHGEAEERAIRGRATPEEKTSLLEDGIEVFSLPLPARPDGSVH